MKESPSGYFTAYDADGEPSLSTYDRQDALFRVKMLTVMGGRWSSVETLCARVTELESELATLRAASAGQLTSDDAEPVPEKFK